MLNILNGNSSSNEVYQRLQGNNLDGTANPQFESLLNMENMIDYMILNFYVGNSDWPGRNHWVGRNRNNGDGFYFYPWDTETALGLGSGLGTNRLNASGAVASPTRHCVTTRLFAYCSPTGSIVIFFVAVLFTSIRITPNGIQPGLKATVPRQGSLNWSIR